MLARFAAYVWTRLVRIRGNCLISDSYTPKSENLSLTLYAANHGDKKRLSRQAHVLSLPKGHQARKERPLFISPNLRDLCAFARDTFFPTSSSSPKFQISLASFQSLRSGRNTLPAYHSQRLAQAVEDMIGTDDVGQAMAVQISLQGRLRVCEHQHNAVVGQVFV